MATDHDDAGTPPRQRSSYLLAAAGGLVVGAAVMGGVWTAMAHAAPKTVATVAGTSISESTLQSELATRYGSQLLEQMIDDKLVTKAAKDAKITASKTDMSAVQSEIEAQYGISGAAQLASFLQASGLTNKQFQQILRSDVLEQKLSVKAVKVTDKEIQSYYNAHKAAFTASGSKTPQPLSKVRSQVVADIQQAQAPSPTQLVANLAKKYGLDITDPAYKSLQTTIEGSAAK